MPVDYLVLNFLYALVVTSCQYTWYSSSSNQYDADPYVVEEVKYVFNASPVRIHDFFVTALRI